MLISVFIIKLSPKCGVSGNWHAVFYKIPLLIMITSVIIIAQLVRANESKLRLQQRLAAIITKAD